jgi:acyl transferase domain-containing protein
VEVQVEVEALAAAEVDRRTIQAMERMGSGIAGDMIMTTIVGHVDLILNTTV